jgi:hypothetical protein
MMDAMTPDAVQWPYLIGGLILGLFGWLLYWAGIPIIGGIVGDSAGGSLGLIIHDLVQANIDPNVFLGVGVVIGAIIGVLLMRKIQTYFFFIVGTCLGGASAWQALRHQLPRGVPMTPDLKMSLIVLGCALLGGFIMVYFRRFIVALGTSVMGALLVTYSIPQQYKLLGGLICLAVFIAVQIGLVRRFVEQEAFDHRMRAGSRRAKYYEDEAEE